MRFRYPLRASAIPYDIRYHARYLPTTIRCMRIPATDIYLRLPSQMDQRYDQHPTWAGTDGGVFFCMANSDATSRCLFPYAPPTACPVLTQRIFHASATASC
eukprot:2975443-Rhodomonas_salina.1